MSEGNAPALQALLECDFEQTIEPTRDRRRQGHVLSRREDDGISGRDVGARDRRHRDVGLARLGRREGGEEAELVAVRESATLDHDARENAETRIDDRLCGAVEVRLLGLERGVLQSSECGAELLVGAAVDTSSDGAKKRMKRERDRSVGGGARLFIAAPQLDVNVLVEGAREAIAGVWEDAPSPARERQIRNRRVVR